MRQEFVQLGDRMIGNAREHIVEPGEGIHFHQLARSNEASKDRRCFAAAIAAEKGPVGTAHGKAALQVARKFGKPIDLLLTDVVAPGMSGPMLAEKLTELQPGLKVLYMSGYDNTHVVKQYVEKQGHALLRKPFDLETLGQKVQGMLEEHPAGAKQ